MVPILFHESNEVSWEDLDMNPKLLRGIREYNFERPSIIQRRAIPSILTGRDIVIHAQEKTGRTTALAVSVLQRLCLSDHRYLTLILEPTRKKAEETHELILSIGGAIKAKSHLCTGGTNVRQEMAQLTQGELQFVVGTPGRVLDMINRQALNPDTIELLVMDEADRLLCKGLIEQISDIFHRLNSYNTQFVYVSNIPVEAAEGETGEYLKDPIRLSFKAKDLEIEGIKQYYALVEQQGDKKFETLSVILATVSPLPLVIYCNTPAEVELLSGRLNVQGFSSQTVYRNMEQSSRNHILEKFRRRESTILVATDGLWRGFDLEHRFVPLVINYNLPTLDKDNYIRRICTGGSPGRKRLAISIVTEDRMHVLEELEQFHSDNIVKMPSDFADSYGRNSLIKE
ncbi:translation initiation factor eIF4A [Entomortierella chlamydospora]|uniref:RNA helicase n=1 Tax=Entomortierella chlamydospora TaxID=101097 RepID=A0A9P6MZX1_9FUNG|nr:translation initiation factor eIF4A [Entomortierella chlamydospora]KAG0020073.1 translation initiation factor eIF4A [Entomortierella chlamydospora]